MDLNQFYPSQIFKFCMVCGSSQFDANSWHSHLCKNCGFSFFTNNSTAVAAIILNKEGQILLTRRKNEPASGMLDLPGGFVEPLESAEKALIRELKEELNLDIIEYKFMASFPNRYLYNNLVYFTCDLTYICSISDWTNIVANDDVSGFEFINLKQLDFNQIGLESIREILKHYISLPNLSNNL